MHLAAVSTPVGAARAAVDAVGLLGALTVEPPAAGMPGWDDVTDLTRALGHLRVLAERLPEVLAQLARHLEAPGGGDLYGVAGNSPVPVEGVVATATTALDAAGGLLGQAAHELATAQGAVAGLYTVGGIGPVGP
jgi:hypothetical protein